MPLAVFKRQDNTWPTREDREYQHKTPTEKSGFFCNSAPFLSLRGRNAAVAIRLLYHFVIRHFPFKEYGLPRLLRSLAMTF